MTRIIPLSPSHVSELEAMAKLPSFSGHHDGVAYTCCPARYGKGCVLTLERDVPDMWKSRAAWLAEGLGGRWARGHQPGYRIAPSRAQQWLALFLAGWDADVPMFPRAGQPRAAFSLGDGPKMTLREAMSKINP